MFFNFNGSTYLVPGSNNNDSDYDDKLSTIDSSIELGQRDEQPYTDDSRGHTLSRTVRKIHVNILD